ncbi:mid1-interacting protein 1-like [Limulus polyphemus]|uniref:Mid1-interacting protein 1-like n=1 Tax=Limulus polyphemus TaxID=6850 RepID=A0ABM1BVB5_LIMPO|nr:mid1-interacting protein 1-like [Limulus polyphemus]
MLHNICDIRPTMTLQHNDSGRHVRRKRRQAGEDAFTCSQQSILSAMDRFVTSVISMDSTVLVPSRLRDMETDGGNIEKRPPPFISSSDLFSFYLTLNEIKNELLWGPANNGTCATSTSSPSVVGSSTETTKHTRHSSAESTGIVSGSSISDSDSQGDSDIDSVTNDPDSATRDSQTTHLATAYRYHLQSLQTILHQLADSADYLSSRYQEEVDASVL